MSEEGIQSIKEFAYVWFKKGHDKGYIEGIEDVEKIVKKIGDAD